MEEVRILASWGWGAKFGISGLLRSKKVSPSLICLAAGSGSCVPRGDSANPVSGKLGDEFQLKSPNMMETGSGAAG
jgi:hypothetical protein